MKLSIIIPVRNEKFLIKKIADQLQSKLKILSYEIIFIDDFSTDNTTEVIKELIKTKPQIKIYNNKRKVDQTSAKPAVAPLQGRSPAATKPVVRRTLRSLSPTTPTWM